MTKIFVISLPRTGTTSVCLFMLEHGYKVAHTAFDPLVYKKADVIADTPVYIDYPTLYELYPTAKFVCLCRPLSTWLPSIKRLLLSMQRQYRRHGHLFNKHIERSFEYAFPDFLSLSDLDSSYLTRCFVRHQSNINTFFYNKQESLIRIDIDNAQAGRQLLTFLNHEPSPAAPNASRTDAGPTELRFPHVNKGRSIAYWRRFQHINKIESS